MQDQCIDRSGAQEARGFTAEQFSEVYAELFAPVRGYFFNRLDTDRAEDLAQEVFEAAWKYRRTFEHRGNGLVPWVWSIARRRVFTDVRYRKAEKRGTGIRAANLDALPPSLIPSVESEALEGVLDAEERDTIRAAMSRILPKQRQLLALAFWGGLSESQIAERFERNPYTVNSLKRQAKAALRRELAKVGHPAG